MSDNEESESVDTESAAETAVEESVPDFEDQTPTPPPEAKPSSAELRRFSGVKVALTAQLGRADVTIQEMMALSEGAVVELDREIGQPVEIIAQGVPLGNGEVVVVDDRFAIRIKEVYQS